MFAEKIFNKKKLNFGLPKLQFGVDGIDQLENEFVSSVTHEFRTPLAAVQASAEIILNTPEMEYENHRKFAGIIIEESKRLSGLIENVMELEKIQGQGLKLNLEDLDLRTIIERSVFSVGSLLEGKNIELTVELPKEPVFSSGDRAYLIQAVLNLLSNAIKFCRKNNGKIWIGMSVDKPGPNYRKSVTVSIKDNGIGIKKEDQELIFHQFRQVTPQSKKKPMGIGLGLTIARQIVDAHNGKIIVKSRPDKGATFFILLPLADSSKRVKIKG